MLAFRLELEAYILQLGRVEAVATQTTVAEVQTYKRMVELMDQEKIDTLQAIEELKRELVFVQQERKNKLEYDQLASEIMKYGTREELENQLASLRTTISNLTGESSKYTDIMEQSQSRFTGIASELKKLRADVGFEVGERERREVEREGEGEVEEERRAGEEAAEVSAAASAREDATGEGQSDSREARENTKGGRLTLNAAAAPFEPRGSTPGVAGSVSDALSKRRRSGRRAGAEDDDLDDDTAAKKRAREEGEMSEADAEQEEEEGAV